MSLSNLVIGKQTGTFGTFEVVDGNVTKARKSILQFFNGTTALVPMDARSSFTTADEHSAFDGTLMVLSNTGTTIQYVESVAKFMNPKARFAEWINGTLAPESVGMKLTLEELAVPSAYASANAKFVELFTPPTPPVPPRVYDERVLTDGSRLRINMRQDKPYTLTNGSYSISVRQAHALWTEHLDKAWANRGASESNTALTRDVWVSAHANERRVTIYPNRVDIGCQVINRNAVEAVAKELGWIA